jgi:G3E family GTPase
MNKKINVYIITGFLGSGKTTLLNNLLKQFSEDKNIIIENEFGKINVDSTLIKGKFQSVYELTNGCICCSIGNQLLDTLSQIDNLEERPNNLFVETTGIANAGEVASTFHQFYVSDKFELKKIICVIDAENFTHYLDSNIEIQKQIVAADIALINKTKALQLSELDNINNLVQSINPYAEKIVSNNGDLDKSFLFTANNQKILLNEVSSAKKNQHKINNVLFETDLKFDINKIKYELFKTLYYYSNQIFRIKGYIQDTNNDVFLVQSIGKTTTFTAVENKIITKSQLVFIGSALELKSIERILNPTLQKLTKKNTQFIS